jgi:hypoxanthine phosphoribosyltransferase
MAELLPYLTEAQIAERVREMGAEIRAAYGPDTVITAVGVLKGSFLFLADLVRAIGGDVRVEFLGVSSYEGTESSGAVRITHDLKGSIAGLHCLVIEDIVDTGLTLRYLLDTLAVRQPASLKVASLLDKPSRRQSAVHADFVGFSIPDRFVVGYGLDLDQQYRNLPYIAIYSPG